MDLYLQNFLTNHGGPSGDTDQSESPHLIFCNVGMSDIRNIYHFETITEFKFSLFTLGVQTFASINFRESLDKNENFQIKIG